MLTKMRHILPEPGEQRGTSKCALPGCFATTREGKPYCSEHIEHADYPAEILCELARRELEAARLDKGLRITQGAHLVRETLLLLRTKQFSSKALARALDISSSAGLTLVELMGKWKLAEIGETERGDLTIRARGGVDRLPE